MTLTPMSGTRCTECGHLPNARILHRHLDGGEGVICGAFVDRVDPNSFGTLCGHNCPPDCTDEMGSETR